jgi:hypothetical protein
MIPDHIMAWKGGHPYGSGQDRLFPENVKERKKSDTGKSG